MRPVSSPLQPGDQGAEVANLQEALSLLVDRQLLQVDPQLLQIATEEAQERVYKDATAKLVSIFQTEHNMPGSGVVDEATANALNNVLRGLGAFGAGTTAGARVVAGQVRAADGRPYAAGRVHAAHVGEPGFVRLGDGTTDGEGSYSIRYELPPGLSSVDLRVDVSDNRDRPLMS
jgi:peptidoglycan hydrolase-like protein with peptidoglycan-binding domain